MSTQLSNCRYCGFCLDDEEIITLLAKHKDYAHFSQQQLYKTASCYGWTPENKKCFKKDIIIQLKNSLQFHVCPQCYGIDPRDPHAPKNYYKYKH